MEFTKGYREEFKRKLRDLETKYQEEQEKLKFCTLVLETAPPQYRHREYLDRFVFTHTLDPRDTCVNTGVVFSRQGHNFQRFAFCSKQLIECGLFGAAPGVGAKFAPIYLCSLRDGTKWHSEHVRPYDCLRENIVPQYRTWLDDTMGEYVTAKEIVGYHYAVLHNRPYVSMFYEELKRDFVRRRLLKTSKRSGGSRNWGVTLWNYIS